MAAGGARATAAMPVIGFLDPRPPDGMMERVRAFRQGLKDIGHVAREKRGDRIPLGRKSNGSAARAGGRSDSPPKRYNQVNHLASMTYSPRGLAIGAG